MRPWLRALADPFGLDDGRRAGATEEVALAAIAAHRPQPRQLQRRLQPLGDDGDAEGVAEVDDGLDDRRVLGVEAEPGDEATVDLDRLDREPLEVRQRRVAGAEVVDGEVQAEAAQVAQGDRRRLDVGEQRGLGDLQPQRVGRDAGLGEHVGDEAGEGRVDDLAGADVDRQRAVGERQLPRPPPGELGERVAQDRRPDLVDQPGLLGHRQELVGRQQAALGVQPAGQRLEAGDVAGRQLDDRLEVRDDLAALEAATQLGRRAQREHGSSRACPGRTPRRSRDRAPWPGTSRRRRRAAGRRPSCPVAVVDRHADARADEQLGPVDLDGVAHRRPHVLGDGHRVTCRGRAARR